MNAKLSPMFLISSLLALSGCAGADETSATADGDGQGDAVTAPVDSADSLRSSEQIGIIVERLDATNDKDWDRWEALHTEDALRTAPELAEPLRGAPALRAAIESLAVAFPDYHLELKQAFGQGEWLAVRIHTTGTMTGPLRLSDGADVPATGQAIEQDWSALVRFDGDHIAEFHEFYDQLTLMLQLGLLSP